MAEIRRAVVYGFGGVFINSNDKPIPLMIQIARKFAEAGYVNIIISGRPRQIYYNSVLSFLEKYQIPHHRVILKDIKDKRETTEFKLTTIWGLKEFYNVELVYDIEARVRRLCKEKLGINALPPEHLLISH